MATSIYEELRDDILSGRRLPGSALMEKPLAEQYGVSRTPVREALLQLLSSSLAERKGRGLVVAKSSPEEVLAIYDMRIVLEEAAARWAAERRTELDLGRILRAHEDMKATAEQDLASQQRAHHLFHEQLWLASHNLPLIDTLERINGQLHDHPGTGLQKPGHWDSVLDDHSKLIEAIATRSVEDAARIASDHVKKARDVRLQQFSAEPISVSAMR